MIWLPSLSQYFAQTSVTLPHLPRKSTLTVIVSRVKVMGAERREAGAEAERETSSWAQSPLSWAVLCTAHYTVQADTAGLGDWGVSDRELARPETRAAIWAVSRQYLLLFPRPRLLWLSLWLSVTECDSVTGVTRDSEIVRKIHLNSSTFYKTPPK